MRRHYCCCEEFEESKWVWCVGPVVGKGLLGVVYAEQRGRWGYEGRKKRGDVGCWGAEEGIKGVYYYEMSLMIIQSAWCRG